ncbi:MAG: MBL fold metallo-hydrolase [Pseudomonadota bacterium]
MSNISRRDAMIMLAAGTAASLRAPSAWAAAGEQAPGYYRTAVGNLAVTTLYDGEVRRPIDASYVRNAPLDEVRGALAGALLPTAHIDNPYTFTAVQAGDELVLIDTGTGDLLAPSIDDGDASMAAAGIDRSAVAKVILTHYHPDHVGGLALPDGTPAFPNATVYVPRGEHAFVHDASMTERLPQMMQDFAAAARQRLSLYGNRVRLFEDGEALASGVRALATPGHTPDHHAIVLEDGGERLIVVGDAVTYPALFVTNPGWHVIFDGDGPRAAQTRRALLSEAAQTGARLVGTHFPFPSIGRVTPQGEGFAYVPDRWTVLD